MLIPAPVQIIGFADPIKQFVGHVFGFSDEVLSGPSELRDQLQEFSEARAWASYQRQREIVLRLQTWGELLGRDLLPALPAFWEWAAAFSHECVDETISPRRALQTFGTEFGRAALGADVWVDLAIGRAHRFTREHGRSTFTLIADCRFDNEVIRVQAERTPEGAIAGRVFEVFNVEDIAPIPTVHESERAGTVPCDWRVFNQPSKGRESLRQELRTALSNSGAI